METRNGSEIEAGLAGRVRELMDAEGLTMKKLGGMAGYSEAAVSRWLSGRYDGDSAALGRAMADALAAHARRRRWDAAWFETAATRACFTVFDLIRESGDVGLVHGPAGIGKTVSCRRYAETNPTAALWTATEGRSSRRWAERGLWEALKAGRKDTRLDVWAAMCARLSGSGRVLIIDNAQRLTAGALRWLMDLHDETGAALALVGNPEVLDRLGASDQLLSRVGFRQDVGTMLKGAWLSQAADRLAAELWPQAASSVRELAREAARRPGHLRTLGKQLKIAMRLCESDAFRGREDAAMAEARHLTGGAE